LRNIYYLCNNLLSLKLEQTKINPTFVNDNFSGGVSGFWIEDGRVAFPPKGLTIAGTADEILNSIDMVANDFDLNKTFTSPTFRIQLMQIGRE
jgi:PmbA protein